ncbi:MAG TPA: tetratricopeptide repeat protein [Frateuria sp.]|uniref:tetratricopeptide repeat protein n=1 Tax=Frateuria sp. TaxID=2211372 RepID=UPI002D7E73EE|nr:tetratricopeptide repeat protein [Frateuria sp.]HET6806374.1 tetratricopeptide repeat protein [Frateuria sp.]
MKLIVKQWLRWLMICYRTRTIKERKMAVCREWARWLALVAMMSLAGCGGAGAEKTARAAPEGASATVVPSVSREPATDAPAPPHEYNAEQVRQFLSAAKSAEAIKDPILRCMAYPDPPGSHWSRDTTTAYCHYHLQHVVSLAEIERLIRSGRTRELDQQLRRAQAQQGSPNTYGLLDETYKRDFSAPTADLRMLLDRWKRESPRSAFAFAASGYAYVAEASNARGRDRIRNTPQARLQTMDALVEKSEADLHRAIELDPSITPAYIALLSGANIARDGAYLEKVAQQAVKAVPDDYSVYSYLMVAVEPKWHGSLQLMKQVAALAQEHVEENPLLRILLTEEPFYAVDNCRCSSAAQVSAYPAVFDQLSTSAHLARAGLVARDNPGMALVYLSEALRFDPMAPTAWKMTAERSMRLTLAGEPRWGLAEADKVLDAHPDFAGAVKARALAFEKLGKIGLAESALKRAAALDPTDIWSVAELGDLYISTNELDKAKSIADQLIRTHADDPRGWVMRASVQSVRYEPGLRETLHYFIAHFGNDPALQATVAQMRAALAEEAKANRDAK